VTGADGRLRVVFPPALRTGDLVALVAPAGPVSLERVEGAVRLLESRGLRVQVRDDITSRYRCFAGSDARRLEELENALLAAEVRAVFLARGGYGTQRILTRLRLGSAAPKPVVGFSDNTALLGYLRNSRGWAVLHGPHPRQERPGEFERVLRCLGLGGVVERPRFENLRLLSSAPAQPVVGEVAGGCLSLAASSVGTPYALDFRGRIVFLEDVGERVYRLDRLLQQLSAARSFEGALAVVFGRPEEFVPEAEGPAVEESLAEFARSAPFPVLCDLPCGHGERNEPLPLGPAARLDPEGGTLEFLEDAVR
jgi:muramoyltetrapeptide carboxypeptidase